METLIRILEEMHPEVDVQNEQHLIDGGILDSFDIVSLIAQIQDEFDVMIDAKWIVPENFNSVESLYRMIQEIEEDL